MLIWRFPRVSSDRCGFCGDFVEMVADDQADKAFFFDDDSERNSR